MRHWVAALAVYGVPASAAAESSTPGATAALSWVRAPGAEACGGSKRLAARVDAQLGRSALVSPAAADLFIEARVAARPAEGGFEVQITVRAADDSVVGVRDIAGKDCGELEESAALAIALLIDPTAGSPRDESPRDESPRDESPREEPRADSVDEPPLDPTDLPEPSSPAPQAGKEGTAPPSPPSGYWRGRITAGGVAALGQLPGLAFGVRGGVALSPPHRRGGLELSGVYLPSQRSELSSDAGGEVSGAAFNAGVWWAPYRAGELSLSLLGGAQIGQLQASGFGLDTNRRVASLLLNAETYAELGWGAGTWSGLVRLGLAVPLWRDSFEVTSTSGDQLVFRPSAVIGSLVVGVGVAP